MISSDVVIISLQLFDYCITFDSEVSMFWWLCASLTWCQVRWVWGRKWGIVRIAFVISRYVPIVTFVMYLYCEYSRHYYYYRSSLTSPSNRHCQVTSRRNCTPEFFWRSSSIPDDIPAKTWEVHCCGWQLRIIISPQPLWILNTFASLEHLECCCCWRSESTSSQVGSLVTLFLVMFVARTQAFCGWGKGIVIAIILFNTVIIILSSWPFFVAHILHAILGRGNSYDNNYKRRHV